MIHISSIGSAFDTGSPCRHFIQPYKARVLLYRVLEHIMDRIFTGKPFAIDLMVRWKFKICNRARLFHYVRHSLCPLPNISKQTVGHIEIVTSKSCSALVSIVRCLKMASDGLPYLAHLPRFAPENLCCISTPPPPPLHQPPRTDENPLSLQIAVFMSSGVGSLVDQSSVSNPRDLVLLALH